MSEEEDRDAFFEEDESPEAVQRMAELVAKSGLVTSDDVAAMVARAPADQQWISDPSLPITCTLSMTTTGTPVFMGRAMVPSPYFTR